LVLALGVLVLSFASFLFWLSAVKARIDAALRASDPCAAASLGGVDVAWAADAQKGRILDLRAQCDGARRRAQLEREEQRRREERALEQERARALREARCASIARRLATSQAPSAPIAGEDGPLFQRIEKGALLAPDMAVVPLPCSDTQAASQIAQAFDAAVLQSPAAWTSANVISERVRSILRAHVGELAGVHKQTFASRAEEAAKRGLVQGKKEQVEPAMMRCRLQEELGVPLGVYCRALLALKL